MAQPIRSENQLKAALIRARIVPVLSTMAGSMLVLLPAVISWPGMPPFGFLILLGWRLLRPDLWPAWAGLPLGLFDDLVSGQPPGSSMALWTISLLLLDIADHILVWRDFWIDWLLGSVLIVLVIAGGFWFAGTGAYGLTLWVVAPQMVLSILCFPAVMRLCSVLDRWRLPS